MPPAAVGQWDWRRLAWPTVRTALAEGGISGESGGLDSVNGYVGLLVSQKIGVEDQRSRRMDL
jgi:hypothetical protein